MEARTGIHPSVNAEAMNTVTAQQEKYVQSLRTTAETLAVARETAAALSQQSEALDRAEKNLDLTSATVKQANHVVRGMSWSGWLYNKFTKEPQMNPSALSNGASQEISMGFICPECRVAQRSQHALMEHYQTMHLDSNSQAQDDSPQPNNSKSRDSSTRFQANESRKLDDEGLNAEQRAFLDKLSPQLLEMKHASLAIGNALDHHNAQLDRIETKAEKTKDDMRLVTAKAIKMTNSSMTIEVKFRCAIQELNTKKFLANINSDPVFCMDTATEACTFRAYTLVGNSEIWGFQHEASSCWLGLNMFGAIKIQGAALRSYEQFALDSGREWTTLYSFSSTFGQGGWVCVRSDGSLHCIRRTSTNKNEAMRIKLVLIEREIK